MDRAVPTVLDEKLARAVRSALASLDVETWRALAAPMTVGDCIPVTLAQWLTVLEDASLPERVESARQSMPTVGTCVAGGSRTVGRRLLHAVRRPIEEVRRLRSA